VVRRKYLLINHEGQPNIRLFRRNPCGASCELCSEGQTCLQCREGAFLAASSCLPCETGCRLCSRPQACLACESGWLLHPSGACKPAVDLYPSVAVWPSHALLSNLSRFVRVSASVLVNGSLVQARQFARGLDWQIPLELPFNSSVTVKVDQSVSFDAAHDCYFVVHEASSSTDSWVEVHPATQAVDSLTSYNDKYSDALVLLGSFDSSGLLVRFSQLLRVYNKLYFMNASRSRRLEAYLRQLSKAERDRSRNPGARLGLLTREKVLSDVFAGFAAKLVCYVLAFCARTGLRFVRRPACWLLVLAFAVDKLHLAALHAAVFDVALYAPITLSVSAEPLRVIAAGCCVALVVLDLLGVLQAALDDRKWRRYYKKLVDPGLDIASHIRKGPAEEPAPRHRVDLAATHENVKVNSHLMRVMASGLRPDFAVYSLKAPRLVYLSNVTRLSLYYLVIARCQSSASLGITAILVVEASRVALVAYYHLKYRVFERPLRLLLEVSQSLFMACLMLLFLGAAVVGPGQAGPLQRSS